MRQGLPVAVAIGLDPAIMIAAGARYDDDELRIAAHVDIAKVIVVDPDVDIYDPSDLLWALTNRVDWSRDQFLVPASQGHEMDPTADMRGVHTKIAIDATYKPERREYGSRMAYRPVELSKYVKREA